MRICLTALYIILLAAAPSAPAVVSNAVQTPISLQGVPGAEIVVSDNGKIAIDQGCGVANTSTKVAVRPQTHFEVGSITKAFTAAAILQLKEQGKLQLTDPLGKYVPEYAPGKDVTLEQLLWHVSGIPDFLVVKGYPAFWSAARTKPGGLTAVLSFLGTAPLEFAPGTKYEYSNSNYAMLALVVERVAHMPWQTYLRKNIFARAGMTQSAFIEDEATLPNMATGYKADRKGVLAPAPSVGHWFDGVGSIVSTASDIARWDAAYFGGKIINMQDVELATSAHVLASGESTGEGFGWWSDSFGGEPRFAYTGRSWGFTAMNIYLPRLKQAIVVLTNDDDEQVWAISNAILGALHPDLMRAYLAPSKGEDAAVTSIVEDWVHRLQRGAIDRAQLTPQLPAEELTEDEHVLQKRGGLTAAIYRGKTLTATGTAYQYFLEFQGGADIMSILINRDGKIADMSLLQSDGRG